MRWYKYLQESDACPVAGNQLRKLPAAVVHRYWILRTMPCVDQARVFLLQVNLIETAIVKRKFGHHCNELPASNRQMSQIRLMHAREDLRP